MMILWKRLRILWLLWRVSRKYPDQRFGQISVNYVTGYGPPELFYIEDWQVIARLKTELRT